jgi:hypothetical protein
VKKFAPAGLRSTWFPRPALLCIVFATPAKLLHRRRHATIARHRRRRRARRSCRSTGVGAPPPRAISDGEEERSNLPLTAKARPANGLKTKPKSTPTHHAPVHAAQPTNLPSQTKPKPNEKSNQTTPAQCPHHSWKPVLTHQRMTEKS